MLEIAGVLSNAERHEQMAFAIQRGFPMLKKRGAFTDEKVALACYGPSLLETWRQIFWYGYPRVITVSGAHDFLVNRGHTPTYHVDIDPRPHKPLMLANPQKYTRYLMASCCHPNFWNTLDGYNVELWHLINGNDRDTLDWVKKHHPEGIHSCIGGGSTVGQRALSVAAALGYRRFDVYGMDCSFELDCHAGAHTGERQQIIQVEVNGKTFKTTPQLLQSAQEMADMLETLDVEITFHGDGLMQEIAQTIQRKRKP